jgi:hypothetical protein
MAARGFMSMRVMHCFTVKFGTMICGMFPACWHRSVVALAIVEVMIDVPVEMLRPVIPGACTDEYAT